jgi:predicted metal-dependent phosphoesterase TrpH
MQADLHTHSIYSDGLYSPDEICRKAKSRGLSLLSITDHDTLAGEEVKRAAAKRHKLAYVTGWEISAYEGSQKIHILGYGCDLNEAYFAFMEERKKGAKLRAADSVQKLQQLGVPVTMEEVYMQLSSPDLPVHTMHVARAAAVHLRASESEVYMQYLGYGKPANSGLGRPNPKEAIECIHARGGIASIAHPGRMTLTFEEREQTIRRLKGLGADGIEVFYTTHTEEETEYFLRLSKELSLFITGGSDTHFEGEGSSKYPRLNTIGLPLFAPDKDLLERLKIIK